jgi:L-arabinonolactonase
MRIEKVAATRCDGGENPLWDVAEQALYYIDNALPQIHRFDPATGETRSWPMPSVITTMVLRAGGGAVVTLRTGVFLFDFASGVLEPVLELADPPPHVYNDGKCDPHGRFLFGACTTNFAAPTPDGGLYRLDADRSVHQLDGGIHFSNGHCFSPGGDVFYTSDSWLHDCYAYDYDLATGTVANRRVFANTKELGGLPDGATVDADGLMWIAIYGGGKIAAFRPDGALERVIDMPVKLVSSVNFGGPDLDRLYVTTIFNGALGEAPEAEAGYVYVIDDLGARGLAEPRFAG